MRPREHRLRLGVAAMVLGSALLLGACTRDSATATPSVRPGTPSPSRAATPSASRSASPSAPASSAAPASSQAPQPPAGSSAPASSQAPAPPTTGQKYVVEPGDTLSTIAEKFGVTIDELVQANRLSNPDLLVVGQELIIPGR
jgi:LysM repeat protein